MKFKVFTLGFTVLVFLIVFSCFFLQQSYATVSVTTATGGTAISADTTGGSYTSLTGPTLIEGVSKDMPGSGTLVISAPSGFEFNTAQTVSASITLIEGSKTCFTFSSTTATPTSTTITYTFTAQDGNGGNPATRCQVAFSGIQVRPTSGTPLASGNITHTGTATIPGITGSTDLGTLTEVAGAKTQLVITTQPSSFAQVSTDFATKPIVAVRDQFGNTLTSDSTTTVARAAVQSAQSCGGTAASGTLSSTPTSGAAVSLGLMTYTAMQHSAVEGIRICFTSSGITSALSNVISILQLPTLTTQDATDITGNSATANGTITSTGGENNDIRGFVYDTSSKSLPGNVAPGSSGYAFSAEDSGSFSTGPYTKGLTGLSGGLTYYVRSYSHNSLGYSYGDEVSFVAGVISITISSSGTVTYGALAINTSRDTTPGDLNNTQTAENDGDLTADFNIRGQNSANWTLTSSSGSEQYVHEFSTNGGGLWTPLTTSYQTLASSVATSGTQNFDLRITTPTLTSFFTQQSVDVTVQAVAP